MSEAAQKQWVMKFGDKKHLFLDSEDPEPFLKKKYIGSGGLANVYKIQLGSVTLALKTTHTRKLKADARHEIEVLRHVSENRHQHIVALIGSYMYTEKQRGQFAVGLVIWPVACFDLKHFLAELEVLARHDHSTPLLHDHNEELKSAIKSISKIVHTDWMTVVSQLHCSAVKRLASYFGCIANALLWLHEIAHVRHRDLKPAQILLSRDGLWLTDFGMSTLIIDPDNSATDGAERMTMRYEAPERQAGKEHGRAEDIFALGCIYLEMGYVLMGRSVNDIPIRNRVGGWSYEGNVIENLDAWLEPFAGTVNSIQTSNLSGLLRGMLSYSPESRPTIGSVATHLSGCSEWPNHFFGSCCLVVKSASVELSRAEPNAYQAITASHDGPNSYRTPYKPGVNTRQS